MECTDTDIEGEACTSISCLCSDYNGAIFLGFLLHSLWLLMFSELREGMDDRQVKGGTPGGLGHRRCWATPPLSQCASSAGPRSASQTQSWAEHGAGEAWRGGRCALVRGRRDRSVCRQLSPSAQLDVEGEYDPGKTVAKGGWRQGGSAGGRDDSLSAQRGEAAKRERGAGSDHALAQAADKQQMKLHLRMACLKLSGRMHARRTGVGFGIAETTVVLRKVSHLAQTSLLRNAKVRLTGTPLKVRRFG